MHTVFALLCFVVVIHWLIFPYPSGLLHWHCGNLTIAPVPAKQPWWIWINTSCEFIMNDCITTTKQSTTKPCAYFLGYTVYQTTKKHNEAQTASQIAGTCFILLLALSAHSWEPVRCHIITISDDILMYVSSFYFCEYNDIIHACSVKKHVYFYHWKYPTYKNDTINTVQRVKFAFWHTGTKRCELIFFKNILKCISLKENYLFQFKRLVVWMGLIDNKSTSAHVITQDYWRTTSVTH